MFWTRASRSETRDSAVKGGISTISTRFSPSISRRNVSRNESDSLRVMFIFQFAAMIFLRMQIQRRRQRMAGSLRRVERVPAEGKRDPPARTGPPERRSATRGRPLLFRQRGDSGEHLALEQFKRRAAAGRNKGHFVGE